MKNSYILLSLIVSLFSFQTAFSQGATCATADPFCSENTYTFPNSTGIGNSIGSNDPGCLGSTPNPAWYYMQIGTSGSIGIDISQVNNSGAGIDVDYILYGPFPNLATALGQCGDLGNPGGCSGDHNCSGEAVDCSYDSAPTEWAEISGNTSGNAVAGQVYMMLLTNFSDQPGSITFEQTSGSGSTDCSILFPPSCGSVDFHAEENFAPYNIITPFPSTMTCEDDWIYLVANDSATSGGYITPALHFEFTPTNDPNDYVNIYSGGSGALGSGTLLGTFNLNDGTILTIYGEYLSPSSNYYFEICDESSVDWTVYDGGLGTIYGNGNDASGNGCTRFGPYSPAGTASWASNAPAASIGANDAGLMYFDPLVAGPGTYNFQYTWNNGAGCVDSELKTITVTNPYSFTSLTYTTVCKSAGGTVNPTLNGTSGGTYSSGTLGASLNTATGAVNIATAPVGTHTINYSVGTMPCGVTGSGTITINSTNTVTPASSSPTVCINSAMTNITHTTTSATGIGAAVGLPSGVTANWAGGVITISGTPTVSGTFNYTIPLTGGCGAVNATGTITVTPANTVSAASSTPTVCINTAITAITHTTTGATGIGAAVGLPAGVTANWAGGTITISGTPSASGTFNYSIPLTGGCGTVNATGTITVTPNNTVTPASSSPTVCINTAMTNITHTTTGATGIGAATGLPAGVSAGWAGNVITISGTPTASGTFNYSIPLTGGCGTVNATGTITVLLNMAVTPASSSPTVCINTAITAITHTTTGATGIGAAVGLPAGVTANWAGGTITISGTPSASGTFNYSIPLTGGCGTVNATGIITVTPNNTVTPASSSPTVCINIAITNITHTTTGATGIGVAIGLPAGVTANWAGGTITISGTPTASGTFNYSIPLTGGCGTLNATGTITVNPDMTVTPTSSTPTVCINTAITNITHTTTGATGIGAATGLPPGVSAGWSGNTITISGTPTASGTFNYSIPLTGACGTVNATGTITVNVQDDPSFAYLSNTHCLTGVDPIPTVTGLAGGNFTISGVGVINATTGEIDLSASGLGVFTVTYSTVIIGNPCPNSITTIITITNAPSAAFSYDAAQYCQDAAAPVLTFGAGSSAGVFSSFPATGLSLNTSNGDITLSTSTAGIYTVYNTIAASGGCSAALDSTTIEILQIDDASFNYATGNTYCLTGTDPIASVTGTAGGVFTISGVGVINATTGEIDLSSSGLGTFTVYYSTPAGNACPQVDSTIINITAAPTAGFSYDVSQACQDGVTPILTIDPGATAGIYSSSPAGLTLNSLTGAITLPSSSGVYIVYNTVAAAGGCSAALDSTTIEILQIDDATFSYLTGATYCLTGTNPIATISGTTGGTFTISSPGVLVDANTGEINLSASGLGTFTVYYNTPASNACPQVDSTTINIVNAPGASFTYNTPFCEGDANELPTFVGNNFPGVFSSNPVGVIFIDTLTGEIDLTTTPSGTYTIYNNLAASGGCAAALDSFVIILNPAPIVTLPSGGLVCEGSTINLTPSSGGTWSSSDTTVATIDNTGLVTGISAGTTNMTFTDGVTGCQNSTATGLVTVNPLPIITVPSGGVVCEGNNINLTPSIGGTWSSSDVTIATIDNTGLVTGISGGTANMVFTDTTTGCSSNVASGLVTVNPAPIINVPSGGIICEGSTISLTPSSGGTWSSSDVTVATIDNTGLVTGISAGTTTMVFTDSITGCPSNITSGLVTVNSLPVVILPSGGLVCEGSTINLTPSSGGTWVSSDVTIATIDNSGLVTGILTGTVNMVFTDTSTGCSSNVASGIVTVNPIPAVTVTSSGIVCAGSTINFTPSSGGIWTSSNPTVANIDNTGLVTGISAGSANMIYTDSITGCSSTIASGLVTVGGVTAVIGATPSSGFMPLDVVFTNTSTTGPSIIYDWNFGDASATSILYAPSHTYNGLGNYIATLIVSDGLCSDTASITIEVIGQSSILIPNVFTPNGDGSNDVFTVDGTNLESVEAEIFNRWGQKMYSWNHVKGYWDGRTQGGIEAPDGTYFYIITAKGMDGEEYFKKGGFSLIR